MKAPEKTIKPLIAIPTYNEAQNISDLLVRLKAWKLDVIVIDDGSHDETIGVVKKMGFNFFSRSSNIGLAGFYATAKIHALKNNYTHLIAIDGDGQHDPRYIPAFIQALQHYDLVSGDRFHDLTEIPASKIASNMFAILLFKKHLNITCPDVACGFRAMKLTAIPEKIGVSRFGIIYDMLIQHAITGKPTGFVPIQAIYHPGDPLNTKIPEINGLLSAISKYNPAPELARVMDSVSHKTELRIKLFDLIFEARYQDPDAYFFQMQQYKH
ncbi:MAG: glycosyltransferase family 2 protein [Bacteroidota bacterium]